LIPRKGVKRALVNVGGAVETVGDASLAARLTEALMVRPGERDATLTHPFHAYPARLHPAVARSLLVTLAPLPGATVLDPFCGSGTVLVEALVAGHRALGRDLSPLAIELASLKTLWTTPDMRRAMVEAAHAVAAHARDLWESRAKLPVPPGEARWFAPHTLREVAALARAVDKAPSSVRLPLRMLLSSVLVKVSLQASDSDPRIVRKRVPSGAVLHFFTYKARELDRCLAALARALPGPSRADVRLDDATALTTVPDRSVDVVLTSPPYANTYDYAAQHARRHAWLGLDTTQLSMGEMGATRWFDVPEVGLLRFRRELAGMCASLARVMAPGARAAVVIADGAVGAEALRADRMLREAAEGAGLTVVARASQERKVFDADSVRAFSKQPKREHVIVLGQTTRSP
jgi:16S rRNA G966 N2-methylase RsmD